MRGAKRFFALFGALALFIVAAGAALPLWFPWVAPRLLAPNHIHYAVYHREGWTHFTLDNLLCEQNGGVFTARRVRSLLPTAWLWDKFRSANQADFLTAEQWTCTIGPGTQSTPNSVHSSTQKLLSQLNFARQWVPVATLRNGAVEVLGQQITLPAAQWSNGTLRATLISPRWKQTASLRASLQSPTAFSLQLQAAGLETEVKGSLSPQSLQANGTLSWQTNRVVFSADFGPTGLFPARASLQANSIRLPGSLLRLKDYTGVLADARGQWQDGQFHLDVKARALPRARPAFPMPPLTVVLQASGDTNRLRIETAKISAPGIEASLAPALDITYSGQMLSQAATFTIAADLARLWPLPVAGNLSGKVSLRREPDAFPDVFFDLSSANVKGFGLDSSALNFEGYLIWPSLKVNLLRVQFANGSSFDLKGAANLQTRAIDAATLQLEASPTADFLPKGIQCGRLSLQASFQGPWQTPTHSGTAKLSGLCAPHLAPLAVTASWRGQSLHLDQFHALLTTGKSSCALDGACVLGRGQSEFSLRQLTLESPGQTLALAQPATLALRHSARGWDASLPALHWRGSSANLDLSAAFRWPENGDFNLTAQNFTLDPFREFLLKPPPAFELDQCRGSIHWSNGPAVFSCDLRLHAAAAGHPFTAAISVGGDAHGIALRQLVLETQGHPVVEGSGELPVVFTPARGRNSLQFDSADPLQLHAHTQSNPAFWSELTRGQRLALEEPSAQLDITGTLAAPRGTLALAARDLRLIVNTNYPALDASNLLALLDFSPARIQASRLQATFRGQTFAGGGELPVPSNFQKNWRELLDWRQARAWLHGQNLQLAAFAQLAPHYLAPQGLLNVDLAATNGQLSGRISITNAQSQPLLQIGAIQNLNADIAFSGRQIKIARCQGSLGGGPLSLSGEVDLSRRDPVTRLPFFALQARGNDVPLSRTAQLILRAAFQLKVSNADGGEPVISGAATLGHSYYLSDPTLLVPNRLAAPAQRPPYFSVDLEPFANWRLNLEVEGAKFLAVQSPFFDGVISASLRVGGTLRDPIALGNVTIDSGQIAFPFANLKVTQGQIYLTVADPYEPHLFITASARAYTYDVRMQVTGPADKPTLDFSSTPGLPSEEILLMLTTGEMPVNAATLTTEQRAGDIGMFVGKNTLSQLGIFPGGEDRLSFGNGEAFGELAFPEEVLDTYSAEYKLTRHWGLIGEYDPYGVSLGLKWLFYAK
jgi:translocation and assembly module TamB